MTEMLLDRAGRRDQPATMPGFHAQAHEREACQRPAVIERDGRTRSREIGLHKAEPCDRFAIVRTPRTGRFPGCLPEGAGEATQTRSPDNSPCAGVSLDEVSSPRAGHPGLEPLESPVLETGVPPTRHR